MSTIEKMTINFSISDFVVNDYEIKDGEGFINLSATIEVSVGDTWMEGFPVIHKCYVGDGQILRATDPQDHDTFNQHLSEKLGILAKLAKKEIEWALLAEAQKWVNAGNKHHQEESKTHQVLRKENGNNPIGKSRSVPNG